MDIDRGNHVTGTGNPRGRTVVPAHGFGCDENMWRATDPDMARVFARTTSLADTRDDPNLSAPEATNEAIIAFPASQR